MTKYFIDRKGQSPEEISVAAYDAFVSGTAIMAAREVNQGFELDLSERLKIRSIAEGPHNLVYVSSTLAKGEVRPVRISIATEHEEISALEVARRLRHVRQLYAILVLIESDRATLLAQTLETNPDADLEQLLKDDERIVLEAAGQGSFWGTFKEGLIEAGKYVAGVPKAAMLALGAIYTDGRRSLLKYVEGVADEQVGKAALKHAEAMKTRAEATKAKAEATKAKAEATKTQAEARSIDKHSQIDLIKAKADAEKTAAEIRKLNEDLRIARDKSILETYEKLDQLMDSSKSSVVKKKIKEHIDGTNPKLPSAPPVQ